MRRVDAPTPMKTDNTKPRPGSGLYSARLFAQKSHLLLAAGLLCAAAFSWGCAGFVAGQNTTNPPPPPPNTYSISGTISPTAGGSGATVTLSGTASATTTASSSGAYTFSGLANGTYAITPSNAGYTFSPTSQNATVNGANVTGINFTTTAQSNTFSLSGTITLSGSALSGAAVALTGPAAANTTTNSSGNYTFSGLANGTYTVTPSNSGDTFTPASQNVTVNGANVGSVNFTATSGVVHSAALSWTASTSVVAGYNIYRGTVSGGPYTLINTSPVTLLTYTDSNVVAGQTYFYVTTAVDGSGIESVFSNEVQAAIP